MCGHRRLHHCHLWRLHLHGLCHLAVFNDVHVRVNHQRLELHVVQATVGVNPGGGFFLVVGFDDTHFLDQRIVECVRQNAVATQLLEFPVHVGGSLLGKHYILWPAGDVFNKLAGRQENAHQRRLDCADGVTNLRGHYLTTAILVI